MGTNGYICLVCSGKEFKTRFTTDNFSVVQCKGCTCGYKSSVLEGNDEVLEAYYDTEEYWQDNPNRQDGGVEYSDDHPKIALYKRDLGRLAGFVPEKGPLLDVGCAKGVFLNLASKEGWDPHGVELSPWASQYARDNFNLEVFTGGLEDSPYEPGTFSAVTALDVIEHVTDPTAMVSKVSELLKPGGVFIVGTPNAGSLLHHTAELLYKMSGKAVSWPLLQIFGIEDNGHIIFFSTESLERLLNKYDMEVVGRYSETVDQGLWRKVSKAEQVAGMVDKVVGGALNRQYRILFFARKKVS